MQFVKTQTGMVNLAYVAQIERNRDGRALLTLHDGRLQITAVAYEDLVSEIGTVIPEHCGTQHLELAIDDGKVVELRIPVVGWVVTAFGAKPILAQPDEGYLVFANGRVGSLTEGSFDSVEDAIADFEKQRATGGLGFIEEGSEALAN